MKYVLIVALLISTLAGNAQIIFEDFEGNNPTLSWVGDNCNLNTNFNNPFIDSLNNSAKVAQYLDDGGQYANIRFDLDKNFKLGDSSIFSFLIYVPANTITGTSNNQIALKLQNKNLTEPWATQCEIIKPISLNKWQRVSFNFKTDPFINLDPNSLPPTQRQDFNRLVLQVNGENNSNKVTAYIDNFSFFSNDSIETSKYKHLVWSDEFNINGDLDSNKWFKQTLLPNGEGWYNGEIQHYTNRLSNSFIANGNLSIVAKKENFTDQGKTKNYTSARINSKFAFTYGRVEIKAKLPTGVGTWPAIWMLGKNINEPGAYWYTKGFGTKDWPACGEIDILEHWGNNQNFVQSAMHTPSSFGNTVNKGGRIIPTASTEFHIYTLEWSPNKMEFAADGIIHYTYKPSVFNNATWPFNDPQYFILNIAIQPGIAANFTQSAMEIDYIRVYQDKPTGIEAANKQLENNLFPNPVSDQLSVQLNEKSIETTLVTITNLLGEIVYKKQHELNGDKLNLTNLGQLNQGIYFLTFSLNKRNYTFKFCKS